MAPPADRPDGAAPEQGAAPPSAPETAAEVLGDRLPVAEAYVSALADTGVLHGLVGPREVPRLWERHVLNCAVVGELVPAGAAVVDIGSGAGLPGLVLALVRPDVHVHLVEARRRATDWLTVVAGDLGVSNVTVHHARAQDVVGAVEVSIATARAVTRIGRLAQWCSPLLSAGGQVLALKGRSVSDELSEDARQLAAADVVEHEVLTCGAGLLAEPTTVARLHLSDDHVAGVPLHADDGLRRGRAGKGRRR